MRKYLISSAQFSECSKYRYLLTRIWEHGKPSAMCIGLNPSTANALKDDPTIHRLVDTLAYHGFGALIMCNLYAIISSKPDLIFSVADPQNKNDEWLIDTASHVDKIIFCWGNFKGISYRAKRIAETFPNAYCFGKNKNGTPWHPLAMMYKGLNPNESTIKPF